MNNGKIFIFSVVFIALFFNITYAGDLIVNSNTTWTTGEYTYDNVTITNRAMLTFGGGVYGSAVVPVDLESGGGSGTCYLST